MSQLPLYLLLGFGLIIATVEGAKKKSAQLASGSSSPNGEILNKSKSQCTEKALRKIGLQMTKVIGFGPNGRPFADSMGKLKSYCKETFTTISQVEAFAKACFKSEIVHLATVYLYSVRNTFSRRICGKSGRKSSVLALVENAPCINAHYYGNDRCMLEFMNSTAQLVNLVEDSLKLPNACCNSVKLMACLGRQIDRSPCLEPNRERLLGVLHGVTSGVSDVACGEFTGDSDKCDRLPPVTTSGPNKKKYHALVLVLIDLLRSIKNFSTA